MNVPHTLGAVSLLGTVGLDDGQPVLSSEVAVKAICPPTANHNGPLYVEIAVLWLSLIIAFTYYRLTR